MTAEEIKNKIAYKFGFINWDTLMQEFWFKGKVGQFNETPFNEVLNYLLNEFSSLQNKELIDKLKFHNTTKGFNAIHRQKIIQLESELSKQKELVEDLNNMQQDMCKTIESLQEQIEALKKERDMLSDDKVDLLAQKIDAVGIIKLVASYRNNKIFAKELETMEINFLKQYNTSLKTKEEGREG